MRRELARRVRRQVVRGLDWEEQTRTLARRRARQVARTPQWRRQVLDSGFFDADWVALQAGTTFASPDEAVATFLGWTGYTPHPLFEPDWIDPHRAWVEAGLNPVVWYLGDERVRARSPHPLIDLARLEREVPGAGADPRGPLAAWLDQADDDSVLPSPEAYRPITLGEVHARARQALGDITEAMRFVNADRITLERPALTQTTVTAAHALPSRAPSGDEAPLVTVVMPTWQRAKTLRPSIESVLAQSMPSWELLVLDDGSTDDTEAVVTGIAHFDPRVRYVRLPRGGVCRARNAGIERARGRYVAFLDSDNSWEPDHLTQVTGSLEQHGWAMAHGVIQLVRKHDVDAYRAFEGTRGHLLVRNHVDLNVLVARTDALRAIGGFDESLRRAVDYDLVLRLAEHDDLHLVPYVGAVYDDSADDAAADRISNSESEHWISVVVDKQVVAWPEPGEQVTEPDRTTVVVAVKGDLARTERWFRLFAASEHDDVDLSFVGVRARRSHHLVATLLASVTPRSRWTYVGSDVSNVVGLNVGAARASTGRVVLTEPQVEPDVGAFRRLAQRLDPHPTEGVAVAQPVLVDRAGLVIGAGAVFGTGSVAPQPFLRGHAQRDAEAADGQLLPAAMSPTIAVRADVLARCRGLYPLFGEGLGEVDLSLRAAAEGLGGVELAADAVLEWTKSEPWGAGAYTGAVKALTARHGTPPAGSADAWDAAGFEVIGQHNVDVHRPGRAKRPGPLETPLLAPRAVVRPNSSDVVSDSLFGSVTESLPSLRWTIDLASPPGPNGRTWGDHHFATSLAAALERLGQRVAVDNRGLRHRDSRDLDDVVLVLRGLDRVQPRPGPVHLMWVISHPDLVTAEEAVAYDRVFAASTTWSAQVSRQWGVDVQALLQCTDKTLFRPDRAGEVAPDDRPAVLFVGSSRGVRRAVVDAALAAGAPLTLHGTLWEGLVPPETIASTYVANTRLGALYAAAGVVLNDHWDDMRRDGFLSNRLFDAVASGARVVSDPVAGVEQVFGEQVQVFHDQADMTRLLTDPDAVFPSRETCLAGAEQVREHHSFDARARTLLEQAAPLVAARRDAAVPGGRA